MGSLIVIEVRSGAKTYEKLELIQKSLEKVHKTVDLKTKKMIDYILAAINKANDRDPLVLENKVHIMKDDTIKCFKFFLSFSIIDENEEFDPKFCGDFSKIFSDSYHSRNLLNFAIAGFPLGTYKLPDFVIPKIKPTLITNQEGDEFDGTDIKDLSLEEKP